MDDKIVADHTVIFLPSGKRGKVSDGTTILDAARQLTVDLDSVCGGRGICSKCQIIPSFGNFPKFGLTSNPGSLSELNATEKRYDRIKGLVDGRRLGCQAVINGNVVIDVPPDSQIHKQLVRKEANNASIKMAPATKLFYVEVEKPDLEVPTGDFDRVQNSLKRIWGLRNIHAKFSVIQSIQTKLRKGNWTITCAIFFDQETKSNIILNAWSGYYDGSIFGVALDLGSTTIAGHLCDLQNGEIICSAGLMNPQIRYGEDLMSRVSYAMMNEDGTEKLTESVREGINRLLIDLSKKSGVKKNLFFEILLVGNPIMHHLLLGINPTELGQAPFALAISKAISVDAKHICIEANKNTVISILPCIAGHVGADAAAVVIAEMSRKSKEKLLVVDVGTNAEILLKYNDKIFACSSPTGPAFEGAQISCGQRAAPGAIEKVRIDPKTKEVRFKIIGSSYWSTDKKFKASVEKLGVTGICGSGIIEAVAEMRVAGILDETGLIGSEKQTGTARCLTGERTNSFLIYASKDGKKEIVISNSDIRAIQLAKAALFAGTKVLMNKMGVNTVDRIVLAGAFGSHISPKHAMILGMIPDCNLSKVSSAGNAAGSGALMALLNIKDRRKIQMTVNKIYKVETAVAVDFQQHFVAASNIPNSLETFPNLKKVVKIESLNFNRRTNRRLRIKVNQTSH